MDLKEVQQFFKDNTDKEDVKTYLTELSKSNESQIIEEYKKGQDFKSEIDRAVTKGIDTFKDKTVPKLIDEKVKEKETELELKYNPPKDPTVEALKKQIEQMQKEKTEESALRAKAENEKFILENIKSEYKPFAKYFLSGTFEDDKSKLDSFNKDLYEFSLLQKTGKPQESDNSSGTGQLTEEQYNALPYEERIKAQNDGRVSKILGQEG